jgi:succinyl-CoA synthetase beta subunit
VNIEEVAATDPGAIVTTPISFDTGVTPEIAKNVAERMGFKVGLMWCFEFFDFWRILKLKIL